MADELPDYLVGGKGVQIVQSPIHTPESGLLSAANVEFVRVEGLGGIGSRRGMTRLNASALAGSVISLANMPFPYPGETDLMVCLNTAGANGANTWKRSVDGTTWTDLSGTQLQRAQKRVALGVATPLAGFFANMRAGFFKKYAFYAGDNYTAWQAGVGTFTAPPLVMWDGTTSTEIYRIPTSPLSPVGSYPWLISDIAVIDQQIFLAIWDPGGTGPDHYGRVIMFDPFDMTLLQVGNFFGPAADGYNAGGFPYVLCQYSGQLYAGCHGVVGSEIGKIYRIQAGIDETWTIDHTTAVNNGYIMSMAVYKGELYAATSADSAGTAVILKRTNLGVWSTSQTAPQNNQTYWGGLIVFASKLFAVWYNGGTSRLEIYVYDGTSWTLDLDVAATYSFKEPGAPRIFRGELYWPFSSNSETAVTEFVLKRTTAGVWSRPLNGVGLRQCLAQYTPQ